MRIALHHRKRLVPHELLYAVEIHVGHGQPGSKSVAKAVKCQAVFTIFQACIEAELAGKPGEVSG